VNCNGITEEIFGFIDKIGIIYSDSRHLSFIIPKSRYFER